MSMPGNVLSLVPVPGAFLAPRQLVRYSSPVGAHDTHYGGVAIGDSSLGITYQLWSARCDGTNIYLSAPNTLEYTIIAGVGAVWVGIAFDQSARVFLCWTTLAGAASYYWYNTLIPGYTISTLSGFIQRIFATLDDNRPAESSSADIILAYTRVTELFVRQQKDRFGVEYDLGVAPGTLVQLGMNRANRLQFAFQNVQGNTALPPVEYFGATA